MALNLNVVLLGGGVIAGAFLLLNNLLQTGPLKVINQQSELEKKVIGTRTLGETCGNASDCSRLATELGPGSGFLDAVMCCNGKCKQAAKGYFEVPTCPGKPLDSPCGDISECSYTGYPTDAPATFASKVGCFDGKCTFKRKDYIDSWWAPNECKDNFWHPVGTCAVTAEEKEVRRHLSKMK